jgi:hypothetical protein
MKYGRSIFGRVKDEQSVSDVFEKLVFEEGAFGVAGRADATLFAAQRQQPFRNTCVAPDPGEPDSATPQSR